MKALDLWLPGYLACPRRRGPITDVLVCVCDHFEPLQATDKAGALARLNSWRRRFPEIVRQFRDADDVGPRQTFFYPIEQYDSDIVREIAQLCEETGSELEFHLHHRNDTAENLEATIRRAIERFTAHGALCRDPSGQVRYGFVHGNWALGNSHPKGEACGVTDELAVLRRTGCYADFTMPSAPDRTQARKVNSLYYSTLLGRKPHDWGKDARVGSTNAEGGPMFECPDHLLLVQGPLGLNWRWRKLGLLPRLENADLTGANPPTENRFRLWLDLGIHVHGRPEWIFIKLHTHGAHPQNSPMLLGPAMQRFHQRLCDDLTRAAGIRLHYVTAREMANVLHAAEAGADGDAGQFRNWVFSRSESFRRVTASSGGSPK